MTHVSMQRVPPRQARSAPPDRLASPNAPRPGMRVAKPAPDPGHCACGGGCPHCQARSTLKVSPPDAKSESQADALADRVLASSAPAAGPMPQELSSSPGRPLRVESTAAWGNAPGQVDAVLSTPGQPLSQEARAYFEPRFARPLSNIRVHTDAPARESARQLGASAYTVGEHIVFSADSYAPSTRQGRRLLAHELAHAVQQGGIASGILQRSCASNADESFYAASPHYCRDTGFSGMFHQGRACYREVPVRSSYFECPPGDQVCFDEDGHCEDSYDEASPVESRNDDGSCNLHHTCTWTWHTGEDVVPGLTEQATSSVGGWLSGLEREIYQLYGVPWF